MINVLTLVFNKYLSVPFESFTPKLILARGLFNLMDEPKDGDLNKIKFIERYTNKTVRVSLYKLDRVINPTKGEFNETEQKFKFIKDTDSVDKRSITLTDLQIQNHLCNAIREIHCIVMDNMKGYKLEMKIDSNNSDESTEFADMMEGINNV